MENTDVRRGSVLAAFFLALIAFLSPCGVAAALPLQGMYDDSDISSPEGLAHLDSMGEAGFRVVLAYTSGIAGYSEAEMKAYLDRAQENDIKVIWDFNELVGNSGTAKLVPPTVRAVKDHPATWGYYVGDENSPSQAADVKEMADVIRSADPGHPRLFVGNYFTSNLVPFVDCADVLGLDVYPIGQYQDSAKMVAEVGTVANELEQFNLQHGKRTVMVLQAFSWSNDRVETGWRYQRWPTRNEMRGMRDQALEGNPELILWFSYPHVTNRDKETKHWEDLKWAAFGDQK